MENKDVLKELRDMRKESMEIKLEIRDSIHKLDSRIIKIETQMKIAVPFITVIITFVTTFIKTKLLGKT